MNKKLISIIATVAVIATLATGCGKAQAKTQSKHSNQVTQTVATTQSSGTSDYYFSQDNGKPDQQLIKVISGAKSNLDIAIYSLTKENIVDAIIKAKSSGVNVRLITDKQESKSKSEAKQLVKLKAAGIPVKINSHKGLMHMKITIADKNIVTTGSYNYTEAATKSNDEVLVILHNSTAAQKFTSEFERMWNDTKNFKEY